MISIESPLIAVTWFSFCLLPIFFLPDSYYSSAIQLDKAKKKKEKNWVPNKKMLNLYDGIQKIQGEGKKGAREIRNKKGKTILTKRLLIRV